jgi:DNA-binding NtrC family response regulator
MDSVTKAPCILVVDDEPDLLAEIVAYLTRRGQGVVGAASVAEARRLLAAHGATLSLMLSDVRMPDGDGVELVRSVLRDTGGTCRCLLVTGHFEHGELDPELRQAGVEIIYKPFSFSQLYDRASGTLGRRLKNDLNLRGMPGGDDYGRSSDGE